MPNMSSFLRMAWHDPVGSLGEFVEAISWLRSHHPLDKPYHWYRGETKADRRLLPKALRPSFLKSICDHEGFAVTDDPERDEHLQRAEESYINNLFLRRSAWLRNSHPNRDFEFVESYFLAQHHGLPTRLLDWTDNAMAALYFAVACKRGNQEDAAVHVVEYNNITITDAQGHSVRPPLGIRDAIVVENIGRLYRSVSEFDQCARTVLPIVPDARAGRMLQQGSAFTLHLPGSEQLENVFELKIRGPRKAAILNELRAVGMTRSRLFPDLDSIATDICMETRLAALVDRP